MELRPANTPLPRQRGKPRRDVVNSVLATALANRNYVLDAPTVDRNRFPNKQFAPTSAEAILEAIGHLVERRAKYAAAAGLFSDEESVDLYKELLAFRILGPCRYALPLSNNDYLAQYEEENQFRLSRTEGAFDGWSTSLFSIEFGGMQVELKAWDGNVAAVFLRKQYYFDRNGIRIEPQPGETVFDCGGCLGDTAVAFAASVGVTGKVVTFEPLPQYQRIIQANVDRNPQLSPVIELCGAAVSKRSSSAVSYHVSGPGSHILPGGAATVSTTSIGEFVRSSGLKRVDFIKMDIEGEEQNALRGAAETISNMRPKLAISAYHGTEALWQIPLLIKRLNPDYHLFLDHYTNHSEETVVYAI